MKGEKGEQREEMEEEDERDGLRLRTGGEVIDEIYKRKGKREVRKEEKGMEGGEEGQIEGEEEERRRKGGTIGKRDRGRSTIMEGRGIRGKKGKRTREE